MKAWVKIGKERTFRTFAGEAVNPQLIWVLSPISRAKDGKPPIGKDEAKRLWSHD